jgi:hypothetical protein
MKKTTILCLLLLAGTAWVEASQKAVQNDASIDAFWERFRAAVIRRDRPVVANLSHYPIEMPYGIPTIRSRAQLLRRYRDAFDTQANAAQCFRDARPEINQKQPREFSVGCKNEAGDEVVIYFFSRTRSGWKFTALDNINE